MVESMILKYINIQLDCVQVNTNIYPCEFSIAVISCVQSSNMRLLSGSEDWHLITGCHLCGGLIPIYYSAVGLSQYDRGC